MDAMSRTICPGDSSEDQYRHRPPRSQTLFAKAEAMLVLPEPAVPESRMLLPLKYPLPPSIASSRGMPEETRSVDTG